MKIKALLFDMGDVFFEANYWRKWMYDKFSRENLFNGSFVDFYELYEKFLIPVYKGKKKYYEAYNDFLGFIGINNPDEFTQLSFEKKEYYEKTRKLFPEVKVTLSEIKERELTTVIITDNEQGESAIRESILKRFEIDAYIDLIFSSKSYNLTKPDPKIYNLVLDKLNRSNNEVLFIGHDKEELDGAEKLGIKSVEFNNYLGLSNSASFKIKNFSELIPLIDELNNE